MAKSFKDAHNAYNIIKNTKIKYGVYHKTLFHLHTPSSYDFTLVKGWTPERYKNISEYEVFQICMDKKILPREFDIKSFKLDGELSIYNSKKEWLSFVLLAEKLLKEEIGIVVVSDHNTIDGIDKLKAAVRHLYLMKDTRVYTEIISAVEISCADRIHVVGLYNDRPEIRIQLYEWFKENLMNEEDGTFRTSLEVMDFFSSIGGIPYIAHINSSDIYNEKKYLSGGYKLKLLSSKYLKIVGISDYEQRERINRFLFQYQNDNVNFILDNDAHDIDSIYDKLFWIKGSKIDFEMVQEALIDFDVSINYLKEPKAMQNIIGLYVEPDGFLYNKDKDQALSLRFSESLNCIIGGRGTGKSTILHLIDFVLGQRCDSEELLNFVCQHGNTWILYEYKKREYLIEMAMPIKTNENDHIMRSFGQNYENKYKYRYRFDKEQVELITRDMYLLVYEIHHENQKVNFNLVANKRKILESFYDTRYSVNDLVNTASGVEINSFIYNMMFKNKVISSPENMIRVRNRTGLTKLINNVHEVLDKRKNEVLEIIDAFNITQKEILMIQYSQDERPEDPNIGNWLFPNNYNATQYYKNFNITEQDAVDYLLNVYYDVGIFDFLKMCVDSKYKNKRHNYSLLEYSMDLTQTMIESEINELNNLNEYSVIDSLFDRLVTDDNISEVIKYLKIYISQIESFSLLFNINSNESNRDNKVNFKDVRQISLGQKVVAMLDFILGYGEYAEDYRPLIIDQPEDNLDSQYIYKNLVFQLRKAKKKRQIIIATHNATIVTNAMSDQVCVMKSDGEFGWIEAVGYPNEKRIKRYILNYLEGGTVSFIHKMRIYDNALEK